MNFIEMERKKGFLFNTDKTKYMIIETGRESMEEAMIMKMGRVERDLRYKWLGNWMGQDGKLTEQKEENEKEITKSITEVKKIGREKLVGKMSTEARLMLYEITVVPGIIYNLEYQTRIEKREIEKLEKIQARVLKEILHTSETTSYWGLIKETGTWTIENRDNVLQIDVVPKLNNIRQPKARKKVIIEQKKSNEEGWYKQTERIASELGVNIERAEKDTKAV